MKREKKSRFRRKNVFSTAVEAFVTAVTAFVTVVTAFVTGVTVFVPGVTVFVTVVTKASTAGTKTFLSRNKASIVVTLFGGRDGEKIVGDAFGVCVEQFADAFLIFRKENQADVFRFGHAIDDFGVVVVRCVGFFLF